MNLNGYGSGGGFGEETSGYSSSNHSNTSTTDSKHADNRQLETENDNLKVIGYNVPHYWHHLINTCAMD